MLDDVDLTPNFKKGGLQKDLLDEIEKIIRRVVPEIVSDCIKFHIINKPDVVHTYLACNTHANTYSYSPWGNTYRMPDYRTISTMGHFSNT